MLGNSLGLQNQSGDEDHNDTILGIELADKTMASYKLYYYYYSNWLRYRWKVIKLNQIKPSIGSILERQN